MLCALTRYWPYCAHSCSLHVVPAVKIFPPAFRCPGEVVKLGEHAICGALETLAKRESCIVYSFSPPEDFHQLQAALDVAVGPEKCDTFGFNLAPNTNGLMYVALPGPNGVQRTRSDERMSFFFAPIDIDNTIGKLSFGDLEQDTEQQYVEPWTHLYNKEHAFLDIIMVSGTTMNKFDAARPLRLMSLPAELARTRSVSRVSFGIVARGLVGGRGRHVSHDQVPV